MKDDNSNGTNDHRRNALEAAEAFTNLEADRQQKKNAQQEKKEKNKYRWFVVQWILLLFCVAVIAFQAPKVISSVTKEEKPHRYGTYETDKLTDECINNLWKISALLQQGKLPDETILCPATQKPYVITQSVDDIIVSSPNPERYGFRGILVSKKRKVPEVIE